MTQNTPLFSMESVSVRHNSVPALDAVSWTLHRGAHCAVLGGNGAGKSTLLRLAAGAIRPDQHDGGTVLWFPRGSAEDSPIAVRTHCGLVSAEQQEHYLRRSWRITGEEIVLSGYFGTDMLYRPAGTAQRHAAARLAKALDAEHLMPVMLEAMSQGQLRKILLARAMVHSPQLLLLDEVCEGLDAAARREMLAAIDRAAALGTTVLMSGHRAGQFPDCIRQAVLLRQGRLVFTGGLHQALHLMRTTHQPLPAGASDTAAGQCSCCTPPPACAGAAPVVEIEHADVYLGRTPVLHDITWSILPGQNWVVRGPNGAGKSTLLRLLYGDQRQAWGGIVRWFGMAGPVPLEEVRRNVALVSDRVQALYGHDGYHSTRLELNGEELVHTGFYDSTGLWGKTPDAQQHAAALRWMDRLGIAALAGTDIRRMSYGTLRRFMLARALVRDPQLLILDEPLSGLDESARRIMLTTLSALMRSGRQLVLVTHHQEDIPPETTHELHLNAGRITYCGPVCPAGDTL
jgi:molybdate transport system ATP-binding protein